MIDFDKLNVSDEIKNVLKRYKVDFVFQAIFSRDGEIVAYEALMRPEGKTILELIEECRNQNKLHELELLSFFGATMVYRQRNYHTRLSINSFPEDCFSREEALEYSLCFRPIKDKLVIEILEFTEEKTWTWKLKKEHVDTYKGIEVVLDDFGTGNSDENAISFYNPAAIKLDRSLICNIDKDLQKQKNLMTLLQKMHDSQIAVLAEGIETREEYDYLKEAGVDYFQGYYLARPQ